MTIYVQDVYGHLKRRGKGSPREPAVKELGCLVFCIYNPMSDLRIEKKTKKINEEESLNERQMKRGSGSIV